MVLGYVVMRVPMVAQWCARGPAGPRTRARSARIFIVTILVSQVGWIVLAVRRPQRRRDLRVGRGPRPRRARRARSSPSTVRGGTPWHAAPHRRALRPDGDHRPRRGPARHDGRARRASSDGPGWTADVALLGLAGVALTFGMWWTYFVIPSGDLLHAHRERSFGWGYGHIPLFGAIVAVGAGLHAAAYYLEHHSEPRRRRHPGSPWRSRSRSTCWGSTCCTPPSPAPSTRSTCC